MKQDITKALCYRDFTFFGKQWKLCFVNYIENDDPDDETVYSGVWRGDQGYIFIAVKEGDDGNRHDLSEEFIQRTVLHEIIHLILAEGKYFNENHDEPLVEWLAKGLLQLNLIDMNSLFMQTYMDPETNRVKIPTKG